MIKLVKRSGSPARIRTEVSGSKGLNDGPLHYGAMFVQRMVSLQMCLRTMINNGALVT